MFLLSLTLSCTNKCYPPRISSARLKLANFNLTRTFKWLTKEIIRIKILFEGKYVYCKLCTVFVHKMPISICALLHFVRTLLRSVSLVGVSCLLMNCFKVLVTKSPKPNFNLNYLSIS